MSAAPCGRVGRSHNKESSDFQKSEDFFASFSNTKRVNGL